MATADNLFNPSGDMNDKEAMVAAATRCVDAFTDRFNARDLAGMDAHLHFPHIILSGEELVVWERPGNVSHAEASEAARGWFHRDHILVRPRVR